MGTRIGREAEAVVIARLGCVRRAGAREAAALLRRAVPFELSGLEHPAGTGIGAGPDVVSVSLDLAAAGVVTELAARFVRGRLAPEGSTVVVRTSTGPARPRTCGRGLAEVGPIPVEALAGRAELVLAVVVGEPDVLRYAAPAATVVVASGGGAPALVAALLVAHPRYLGPHHCDGDAALATMARTGAGTARALRAALAEHEAALVAELMAGATSLP